jgi:hypothetical protein
MFIIYPLLYEIHQVSTHIVIVVNLSLHLSTPHFLILINQMFIEIIHQVLHQQKSH